MTSLSSPPIEDLDVDDLASLPEVDQAPDRSGDDALVFLHRLTLSGGKPAYVRERNLLRSDLEAEYSAKS